MLRKHQYRKVVDNAFSNRQLLQKKPGVIVAVLDQLRLSGQLPMVFSGRQGHDLHSIINFISQHLFNSAFFDVLYDAANIILSKSIFLNKE